MADGQEPVTAPTPQSAAGAGPVAPSSGSPGAHKRRRWPVVLIVGVVVLGAVSPFLWAGYHSYAGRTALKRYHSAEARDHFNACLRIWPWSRDAELHRLAARAARREGDLLEARRLLHHCQTDLHDDSAETVLEWAMLRAAMGDLDTTAEPLRTAARQDLRLIPLVLEALTIGYLTQSRILDALRCTDDWLALEPNNPQAWFVRGTVHGRAGAAPSAADDFQHVLDVDPERSEAHWWLGIALLDIGRYQEAYQQLDQVRRQRPEDVETQVRLAMCLQRLGREQEACELLDGVLARHPDHGLALSTRGQIDLAAGRLAESEKWLRQAVRVLPYDYKAQNALWECLRQQGKTEEAESQRERKEALYDRRQRQSEILTHLMSQKPDDAALQSELGTLFLQLGQPEVGEGWLLNAVRLDEHYVPALETLANYYQERGDARRAEAYRARAQQSAARNRSHPPRK